MTIQQGWECPRCNLIHAPWAPTCNCNTMKDATITFGKPFTSHEGPHDFSTAGVCVVCGFKQLLTPPATTASGGSGNPPGEQNVF